MTRPGALAEVLQHRGKTRATYWLSALGCGLPPEKWSSLRYGFEPCGGHFHGTEEAYG